MNKYAAFDLEIAKELPEGTTDWREYSPLGISCAALAFSDNDGLHVWKGIPQMSEEKCQLMVDDLLEYSKEYTLVTWNGCKFDFPVMAEESGMLGTCTELARNHIDLMMIVTFTKGWYLGLDAALKGQGLESKLKSVTLNDGSILNNMSGALAPKLWADGEYDAVLSYLEVDVVPLAKLAAILDMTKALRWTSQSGRPQTCYMNKLYTVDECFSIPKPDTSWMTDPPKREDFVDWMEK